MRDVQKNRGIRRTGVVGVLDASKERGERGLVEGKIAGDHHESTDEPIRSRAGPKDRFGTHRTTPQLQMSLKRPS